MIKGYKFIVSEEEKNRILNLHEESSKNQYLVIVAPPTCQTEAEITQNLHAFVAKGFRGVTYAKGVWHHPLISLDKEQDFLNMIGDTGNVTVKFICSENYLFFLKNILKKMLVQKFIKLYIIQLEKY